MVRRGLIVTFAVLLAAGQALALSCVPPDAARAFREADERPELMLMVLGELRFDPASVPTPPGGNGVAPQNRPPVSFTARFVGHSAQRRGFRKPLDTPVEIRVHCASVWCGSVVPDTPILTFLEKTGSGYVLDLHPCSGNVIKSPTPQDISVALACLRREACAPAEW